MVEIFGTVAPTQLLLLMAFPLGGAVILAGIIVWSVSGRAKRGKMKHGIPLKEEGDNDMDMTPENDQAEGGTVDEAPQQAAEALGLNMDILKSERQPQAERQKANLPAEKMAEPVLPPAKSTSQATETVELLRLLRDSQSGRLIVEVGGQRYKKLADVADKKIGQYILKLAAHLLAFTSGMIVTEAGVKSVYNPKVGAVPEPVSAPVAPLSEPVAPLPTAPANSEDIPAAPAEDPPIPKPSPEAEAAFLALQARAISSADPMPPPAPSSGRLFGRSRSSTPAPALPGLNLADEINQIVQTRLTYSPLGADNRVDVIAAPDGGIRINVNGMFYETTDEIPDADIKNLVKESIKQWERS